MQGNDETLNKSLDEISAQADEILKSLEAESADDVIEKGKAGADKTPATVVDQAEEEGKDKNGEPLEGEGKENANKENVKKSEGADEEEGKDDEEDVQKSFEQEFSENEVIQKSIDASSFLEEFTKENAKALDSLRSEMAKSIGANSKVQETFAKSLKAVMGVQDHIVKSQAALSKSIEAVVARLETVERTPVGRKSIDNINVVEKSFNHSAGVSAGEGASLNKSETLEKMSNLVFKGVAGITVQDVVQFESTGQLNPRVQQILSQN